MFPLDPSSVLSGGLKVAGGASGPAVSRSDAASTWLAMTAPFSVGGSGSGTSAEAGDAGAAGSSGLAWLAGAIMVVGLAWIIGRP